MKIKDAANILNDLVQRGDGDQKLSVYVDGRHHTEAILFYPVGYLSDLQVTNKKFKQIDRGSERAATFNEEGHAISSWSGDMPI